MKTLVLSRSTHQKQAYREKRCIRLTVTTFVYCRSSNSVLLWGVLLCSGVLSISFLLRKKNMEEVMYIILAVFSDIC